jgi:adenosylcobinamide kinase/adenosylcobinamide-phosphate guanylyltransferase
MYSIGFDIDGGALMNRELILLLGGARSGKSRFAEKLAARFGGRVLYVATAQARDEEMAARIAVHQGARPATWRTVEAPTGVGKAVRAALAGEPVDVVLLDCITLLVSNVIMDGLWLSEEDFDAVDERVVGPRVDVELDGLLRAIQESEVPWIVVSNEVGWGLVPPYPVGRVYRDLLGWFNQCLAAVADRVYLMVAGLPVDVKALSEAGS